ncbi:PTS sugar transporter subunit IIB [Mycoplasma tauri]|uniref:PTS sugar transporter subunit IIB n=1 Tax=Mycoplasma tauri TaxID=547987 RepID=A0A953NGU5_9MOLU|nr:PTS sugar transporter subunit IIB [Mycoplasma tauri]MBZ4195431.1 PTS sugar transporter subunit IIB [Mycoplasma tauri]MBZ4203581.1 PTS sugar transporter subunit IIB [Mycoplasma tauri]MBZ4204410.1 PTS sugar transporter subunit IIB [Mycoplasma tauri]MBZ4212682.1 PTS sugar transporter subunit IIB [Mycoplasma tauri]MBZ4218050.1 PTS sugar transporter subunit IIB [Mycoplasma tauri]
MKVLCLCGSGMGTSMIIKLKTQQALRELGIEGSVEALGLGMGKSVANNFDVILCTQNFVSEVANSKAAVYGLKNIMDINEIKSAFQDAVAKGIK